MPAPATQSAEANLIEIFSSIQGEGILVGCRQLFLRFAECNLDCRYCDTDFQASDNCQIEDPPGSGKFRFIANPLTRETVVNLVRNWTEQAPGAHHSLSLTGGEPLLQAETLRHWLPELRRLLPIFLETNGTLPRQLEILLPYLDWVSMDFKLSSQTGLETNWDLQRRFLQLASQTCCYVKIVVGDNTPDPELRQAAELVAETSAEIPLILQPVTSAGNITLTSHRLLAMQQLIAAIHANVRVIPQTHRFMAVP